MMTMPQAWHSQSLEEVYAQLHATAAGLTTQTAAERLTTQGPNEIQEGPSISAVQIFFRQFKSLIIWILIAAGIISGFLGELIDCLAILAIVVLNAAIGFYQEYKAEKSIAALKQLTAPKATVLRDGQRVSIPATEVVSGDVLALEAGDLVPADARILEAASLRCVESALTGEAKAAAKRATMLDPGPIALGDRTNMVFMGTTVATGTAMAVVVGTAMGTELGAIAGLMEAVGQEGKTPLQKKLDAFGKVLVWATLGIVVLLFVLGLWRGAKPFELLMTAVSLAVAAVPEGLPAIVTVALALGVMRMARRRSLVRKLPAVETLGSTTVICTDKTGTLTVGKMTARALYVAGQRFEVTGEGYGPTGEILVDGKAPEPSQREPLLELASILLGCNQARLTKTGEAWQVMGDPTEGALLVAGLKAGGNLDRLEQTFPKQLEFPFDSDRKRSSVVRRQPNGSSRAYVNGAPGVILALCTGLYTATGIRPLTEEDRHTLLAATQAMAAQALRVLGSAYRDLPGPASEMSTQEAVEQDLVFVGLTGMYDPPRAETKGAVATCQAAGIRVVMITGDHPETAAAIGREIGLAEAGELAVTGIELDELSDTQLQERISKISVFARVTAAHKLRIVRAWKATGAVVAMTGDGVNDAPAIKGADIGIAMGESGTEVTKQAADIILTDDNFASIVAAVEEGRGIRDNIRKTLQYLLAGNTGELLLMTLCVVSGLPTPLLPIHLLWINLVTDGLPALCLATDPIDPDLMKRVPAAPSASLTDATFFWTMGLTGLLTAGVAFGVYLQALQHGTPETARTYAFTVLVFAELLRAFGARSETKSIWRIPFFTNLNLALVVGISIVLQVWSQHSVAFGRFLKTSFMPFTDCLWLFAVASIPLVVLELVKLMLRARSHGGPARGPRPPSTSPSQTS